MAPVRPVFSNDYSFKPPLDYYKKQSGPPICQTPVPTAVLRSAEPSQLHPSLGSAGAVDAREQISQGQQPGRSSLLNRASEGALNTLSSIGDWYKGVKHWTYDAINSPVALLGSSVAAVDTGISVRTNSAVAPKYPVLGFGMSVLTAVSGVGDTLEALHDDRQAGDSNYLGTMKAGSKSVLQISAMSIAGAGLATAGVVAGTVISLPGLLAVGGVMGVGYGVGKLVDYWNS